MQEVVIVSASRTPIGSFQGTLSGLTAPELGAAAIRSALNRAGLAGTDIDEVIFGQVLTAGVGQAPARQAALGAELPVSVPCMTINKVCGSGLKAAMLAAQAIRCGDANIVVAGGMESMSNAPYLLPAARAGMRMGNKNAVDSMIHDGLWDPYGNSHMGGFGDLCAEEESFSREDQDAFAEESYRRALAAQQAGHFAAIEPVEVKSRKKVTTVSVDEEPKNFRPEKMASLRPAFGKEGTVTAANASKLNDGAAAVIMMSKSEAERRGSPILARWVGDATFAQEPKRFTTAPAGAIQGSFEKCGLTADDVDLYEINEAFSVVTMATMKAHKIPHEKVNVWGGAVALGHPIGASGARLLVTLLSQLSRLDKKRGLVSLCIGGGEAVSVIVER